MCAGERGCARISITLICAIVCEKGPREGAAESRVSMSYGSSCDFYYVPAYDNRNTFPNGAPARGRKKFAVKYECR